MHLECHAAVMRPSYRTVEQQWSEMRACLVRLYHVFSMRYAASRVAVDCPPTAPGASGSLQLKYGGGDGCPHRNDGVDLQRPDNDEEGRGLASFFYKSSSSPMHARPCEPHRMSSALSKFLTCPPSVSSIEQDARLHQIGLYIR